MPPVPVLTVLRRTVKADTPRFLEAEGRRAAADFSTRWAVAVGGGGGAGGGGGGGISGAEPIVILF
jgi:hypothetical protein